MTTLCDRCQRPGSCCTFTLYGGLEDGNGFENRDVTALEILAKLASAQVGDCSGSGTSDPWFPIGLPFLPLGRRANGRWWLWCPLLVAGRCSIYEDRPSLCRHYQAGSDLLCWHHDQ